MTRTGADDTRSKLMSQHNRIVNRAMANDNDIATFPLPIVNLDETLHTLMGLFPLSTFTELHRRMGRMIAVISGTESEQSFQLSAQPAATPRSQSRSSTQQPQPAEQPEQPVHRSWLSDHERDDIIARRERGETHQEIADAIGRSTATVSNVMRKHKKEGGPR